MKSSPAVDPVTGLVIVGSHDGTVYALKPEVRTSNLPKSNSCLMFRHKKRKATSQSSKHGDMMFIMMVCDIRSPTHCLASSVRIICICKTREYSLSAKMVKLQTKGCRGIFFFFAHTQLLDSVQWSLFLG